MHIEEDKMHVLDVHAQWHITEMNTKYLLQQPSPCVNIFLPWKTGNYDKASTFHLQLGTK
jgi:hypothetical protein